MLHRFNIYGAFFCKFIFEIKYAEDEELYCFGFDGFYVGFM